MIWPVLWGGTDFKIRISREQFKIHSIFRSVCNLQASDASPLICLVTKREMSAPNALFVKSDNLYNYIEKGMPVHFTQGILQLGPIMVNCSDMQIYHSIPKSLSNGQDAYRIVAKWLDTQWPGWNHSKSRITLELANGLLLEDENRLQWALERYIGFGEGLTPSGDDFVSGIMLSYLRGLHKEHRNSAFMKRLPLTIYECSKRTNAISQTMLWYAVHGEGSLYLTEVADALYSNSFQALSLSTKLFKVGASSGRYLLAGLLTGFILFQTKEQLKDERRNIDKTTCVC